MKYAALVKAIHSATAQLQGRTAVAVNQALILRNWLVGEWILEFEQHGKRKWAVNTGCARLPSEKYRVGSDQ